MGYNIRIGNAELESSWPTKERLEEYGDVTPEARWVVKGLSLENAPHFEDSGRGNGRYPSYSTWADFCRKAGIYDWMLERWEGKMGRHPGCAALFLEDAEMLTEKLDEYRQKYPNAEAIFCECLQCDPWAHKDSNVKPQHNPNASGTLVRLAWLTWWVNWAVKNCERPAIYNT